VYQSPNPYLLLYDVCPSLRPTIPDPVALLILFVGDRFLIIWHECSYLSLSFSWMITFHTLTCFTSWLICFYFSCLSFALYVEGSVDPNVPNKNTDKLDTSFPTVFGPIYCLSGYWGDVAIVKTPFILVFHANDRVHWSQSSTYGPWIKWKLTVRIRQEEILERVTVIDPENRRQFKGDPHYFFSTLKAFYQILAKYHPYHSHHVP
jgi:hypothetical protein